MLRFESATIICCLIPVESHDIDPRRQNLRTIKAAIPPTKLIYILLVICQQKYPEHEGFLSYLVSNMIYQSFDATHLLPIDLLDEG
jgi:hypothetical protein